jgi:diaminopimelate epimerase
MRFTKMHGIGNDYVYVNGFAETVADPTRTAIAVSDRHFGVGSDGLILILPPTAPGKADVRMRMFNADGSEGEMCGNGVGVWRNTRMTTAEQEQPDADRDRQGGADAGAEDRRGGQGRAGDGEHGSADP